MRGFEPERARAKGAKSAHGRARQPAEAGWRDETGCRVPEAKSSQPDFSKTRPVPPVGSCYFGAERI
jgi:hypothetical protein